MIKSVTVATLAAVAMFGQSENSSAVQGFVRDAQGKPVAGASVQVTTNNQTLSAFSDAQGSYTFRELRAASYTVHASETKLGAADFGPFALGPRESKKVDLTLASPASPQFFDQPTFIVAGVTDPALRGGHGSDPVFRSAETGRWERP